MQNIKEIITIASAALGLFATLTGLLVPLIKNVKAKKRLAALSKLSSALQNFIVDAEQFAHYTGEEKKQYALTRASRYAQQNNLPFDEQQVDAQIEEMVALTKSVNSGARSKEVF